MGRLIAKRLLVVPALVCLAAYPAMAQVISPGEKGTFSEAAQKLQPQGGSVPAVSGIPLAPGVTLTAEVFKEGGIDTNPDQSFTPDGSGFLRAGFGLGLTAINEDMLASVVASGSWLHLTDFGGDMDRPKATVEANVLRRLMPGVTLSVGALYDYDEVPSTATQTIGTYAELGHQNELVTSYLRGRFIDARYLTEHPVPIGVPPADAPLYSSSAFDAQRSELSGGMLVGNNRPIGFYGEAAVADMNYVNQPLPMVVNRDATDFYAKAGIRLSPSSTLHTDLGWRWNYRNLSDPLIGSFDSNFFDGSITWGPSPYFFASASIDRSIGEPSSAFGRAGDITSTEVKLNYIPFDGTLFSLRGARQTIVEVGAGLENRVYTVEAGFAYDLTNRMQLYSTLRYEYLEAFGEDQNYDRTRFAVGVRSAVDGHNPFEGMRDASAGWGPMHLPNGAELILSGGYSAFDMPAMNVTTVVGGAFFDEALFQLEEEPGDFSGGRIDARLARMTEATLPDGRPLSFSASAFYSRYTASGASSCFYTAFTDCAFVNIDDFDAMEENNTGPFGQFTTNTDRRLHYWGFAVDARPGVAGDENLLPIKFGLGARGLHERSHLHATDAVIADPVDYKTRLDTLYLGAFVGIEHEFSLGDGWSVAVDGQAGLYGAGSDYQGRYLGFVPVGGPMVVPEQGSLTLSDRASSFIGSGRIDVRRDLGWATLGVYGMAEYLSQVPFVRYNNNDNAGGSPFGVVGTEVGTSIDWRDAFNYTVGLNLTIPFDKEKK
jgi:hypothetical protein